MLETIYFGLPALVNRYSVYAEDIAAKGFHFVEIDEEITIETTTTVVKLRHNPELMQATTAHNYRLAKKHYSYSTLRQLLSSQPALISAKN